jgi:5-methylcytosine-specific restriction endonuclease McrBC regulatory subunit McrC
VPSQIRLVEWSTGVDHKLSAETQREIHKAAEAWRDVNSLPIPPLSFVGPDGSRLSARQYVGVIEVNDVAVEIYPKLDAALIEAAEGQALSPSVKVETVMHNLLWMLEVANYRDLAETETAHLEEAPTSFLDLFAYLLGKNLLPELERGVSHAYVGFDDDLRMVRGRIGIVRQVTQNWNRLDRVYCAWDEFTSNTAINRLFKCACRFLSERVNYREATRLLRDCQVLLSEVEDVFPTAALREVGNLRFDRSVVRFKTAFDLARRLLMGIGHNLGVGSANTFVFLMDMNEVFEKYVHAVLESHFRTAVKEQKLVGSLLCVHPGGMAQKADYFWHDRTGSSWIGDAKYKHLAKGHVRSLRFSDLEEEQNGSDYVESLAGRVLSAGDVRQLTVYAELDRLAEKTDAPPNLMLLYPFVGAASQSLADSVIAWNESKFWLMPVLVKKLSFIGDAIQFPIV